MISEKRTADLQALVATNIRAEMAAQELTSAHLASLLDVRRPAALARMRGKQGISLNELERIADWLGVSQARLMKPRDEVAR